MLTGRSVDGRRAKKLGLVDALTPRRHFRECGSDDSPHAPAPRRLPLRPRATNWPVRSQPRRVDVGEEGRAEGAPRPLSRALRVIDLWKDFGGDVRKVPPTIPRRCRSSSSTRPRATSSAFHAAGTAEGFGKQDGVSRSGTCT
jgi:3-hydroxyacyl-CoA dehydrogenase/enoyl-CoA hydratase/3-hydroxybutyryl-CoA epimerase